MDPKKNKSAEEVFTKILAATGITSLIIDIGVLVQKIVYPSLIKPRRKTSPFLNSLINLIKKNFDNFETQIFEMAK